MGFVRFRPNVRFSAPLVLYLLNGPNASFQLESALVTFASRYGMTSTRWLPASTRYRRQPNSGLHGTESFRYDLNVAPFCMVHEKLRLRIPSFIFSLQTNWSTDLAWAKSKGSPSTLTLMPIHSWNSTPLRSTGISVFPPLHFRLVRVVNALRGTILATNHRSRSKLARWPIRPFPMDKMDSSFDPYESRGESQFPMVYRACYVN